MADQLKAQLARGLQEYLVQEGIPLPQGAETLAPEPESIEVTRIDNLGTMVRVKYPGNRGPRYFQVRFSEVL